MVLLSPDELGTAILLHFSADGVGRDDAFVVEWAIATDDRTRRPRAVWLYPFWDGLRYYARDDDIACGSEVDVRVASVYADGETSAWAEASIVAECAPSPKPTPKPSTKDPTPRPSYAPSTASPTPTLRDVRSRHDVLADVLPRRRESGAVEAMGPMKAGLNTKECAPKGPRGQVGHAGARPSTWRARPAASA